MVLRVSAPVVLFLRSTGALAGMPREGLHRTLLLRRDLPSERVFLGRFFRERSSPGFFREFGLVWPAVLTGTGRHTRLDSSRSLGCCEQQFSREQSGTLASSKLFCSSGMCRVFFRNRVGRMSPLEWASRWSRPDLCSDSCYDVPATLPRSAGLPSTIALKSCRLLPENSVCCGRLCLTSSFCFGCL